MGLSAYRKKRNFSKTSEPRGVIARSSKGSIFVVQKHHARSLHYDFRLEIGGVLKSWAVPKGPSSNPTIKRLAVQTEDHPLAYADFQGVIPEGEYGAGRVEIWDRGTFKILGDLPIERQYNSGRMEFELKGRKLYGAYVLIKIGQGKNWLLKKLKEEKTKGKIPKPTDKKES